jgi:hypothetical protein
MSVPDAKRILFITEQGTEYERIFNGIRQLQLPATFFLIGGAENYHDHLSQQIAMQGRHEVTITGSSISTTGRTGGGGLSRIASCGCGNKK